MGGIEDLGDGDLVLACAEHADAATREAAFAELVSRHGPMVLGTCRRIVGLGPDADDAAQATLLTLVHKARALRGHPSLGGWLHRVARHVALRSRDARLARQRHELGAAAMTTTRPVPDPIAAGELREELDGALDRLAERYRLPLVLHYLEGRSQDEVARLLDMRPGTLASLLSRGRDLLRTQLARRGAAVGAAALVSVLAEEAAHAALPIAPAFAAAAGKSAALVAAGTAAGAHIAPQVAALTHGALKTMTIAKLKFAACIAAGLLAVGGAAGTAVTLFAGEAPPAPAPAPVVANAEGGPGAGLQALIKALRANDISVFLTRLPADQQDAARKSWQSNATPPAAPAPPAPPAQGGQGGPQGGPPGQRGNRGRDAMVDRLLAQVSADDAAQQLGAVIEPFITQLKPDDIAASIKSLSDAATNPPGGGPGGGPGGRGGGGMQAMMIQNLVSSIVGSVLASGLETQQTEAIQAVLDDLAAWIPTAGLQDGDKAKQATAAIAAAGKALGAATSKDLFALSLDDVLAHAGKAAPELKKVLAVYGLDLDQILATAQVTAGEPRGDECALALTFTAFTHQHSIPLKATRKDGKWQVVADSPVIAWLKPRFMRGMPWMMGALGGPGGPGGNGQGGRPRGQRGQGGPPAPVAPADPNGAQGF